MIGGKNIENIFSVKASVFGTDVPIDVQLHPANKFASAAEHPPAALKSLPLQKRENH